MKTLHIIPNKNAVFTDSDTNDVIYANTIWASSLIDYIYISPFDCEIRYTNNGKTVIKKAAKGDVILQFKDRSYFTEKIAVIKNEEFKTIAKEHLDKEYENKIKWADHSCKICENCSNDC